ncbi:hypothetical protein OROMI_026247 [Orobanche minor]
MSTSAGKITTYNCSDITWAPYGPYWRQARKMCLMELFSVRRIESYEYIRAEEMSSLLRGLRAGSGRPLLLKDFLSTVSLNVISRMVLGRRYLDGGENAVVSVEGCEQESGAGDYASKDMVDVLLELADQDGPGSDYLWPNSLAGGTESSAVTVEWAISELLKKPEIFKKATEELDRVIGGYCEGNYEVASMLVPRLAREDCKKGTQVLVNTHGQFKEIHPFGKILMNSIRIDLSERKLM